MTFLLRHINACLVPLAYQRSFSVTATNKKDVSCKLLILGGGAGGCSMAARFSKRLSKDAVCVVEPSHSHFYQPLWTLVGAGVKTLEDTRRSERDVLPKNVTWIREKAECIDPDKCVVEMANGVRVSYEFLIVAVGVKMDYHKILGLKDALDDPCSMVSTIYSANYCEKSWRDLQAFRGGRAVYTYPQSPIKCPGAPQKIAYLADSYLRKKNLRKKSQITYATSLGVIFGVKKYADALEKVVKKKDIRVAYQFLLSEIRPSKKQAVFVSTSEDCKGQETTMDYNLLHVTPPMSPPSVLSANKQLADPCGYLDVDKFTLQHKRYPNIYGIGDCTSTPNSKTAAAVALQSAIVEENIQCAIACSGPAAQYNGYGACPLLTSYSKCILAEFTYDGVPRETFPFNQANESRIAYYLKKDLFPMLYWNFMLKGNYSGPEFVRKIINPFAK